MHTKNVQNVPYIWINLLTPQQTELFPFSNSSIEIEIRSVDILVFSSQYTPPIGYKLESAHCTMHRWLLNNNKFIHFNSSLTLSTCLLPICQMIYLPSLSPDASKVPSELKQRRTTLNTILIKWNSKSAPSNQCLLSLTSLVCFPLRRKSVEAELVVERVISFWSFLAAS